MQTLEDYYKDKAFECTLKGDSFGASYWYQRAYEVSCLGD
jgi:hypothetical protein